MKTAVVESCAVDLSGISEALPYIVFGFTVFNGSVYSISVKDAVDGHTRFAGKPLDGHVQIFDNLVKDCPRGSRNYFKIRQRVLTDEAAYISEKFKSLGNLFDFSELSVIVDGGNHFPDIEPARLDLTRGMQNAGLENKITVLQNDNSQLKDELTSATKNAIIIERLSTELGRAYSLYNILENGEFVSRDRLKYLNACIHRALTDCFNYDATIMDKYFEQLPLDTVSDQQQRAWVDRCCFKLRQLIEDLRKENMNPPDPPSV